MTSPFVSTLIFLAVTSSQLIQAQQQVPSTPPPTSAPAGENAAQQKIRAQAETIQKQADDLYKMFRDIPEFQQLMANQSQLQRLSNLYAQAASQGAVATPQAAPASKEVRK